MVELTEITKRNSYALAPEILLTNSGAETDHVIVICDGEIVSITSTSEYDVSSFGEAVKLPGCAITPGFVDAHTHLGQAFGKGITGGEPAQIWRRIWTPLESSFDPETVYISAKWMFLEALRGGFTTIVNFGIQGEEKSSALHRAAIDVGIRLVSSTGAALPVDDNYIPEKGNICNVVDDAIARAEAHLDACKVSSLISPSFCVPAVQGAPGKLIEELSAFSAANNAVFQIHTNEHHVEVHWSVSRYGNRPLEYFAKHGAVGPHTLHHHCTLITDREIEILRDSQSGVSYNPLASAWKGDRVAPALAFSARGVRFGVGTDSTRSDAFRLLESAETAQRFSQGMQLADFSCGAAWTWIDAATRGSADVAGLGNITGELRPGLRADFLVLDRMQPEVNPSWDFEWELVRLYNRDQIEAVVIDGKSVMKNSQPVGWDGEEFLKSNLAHARDAVIAAPIIRRHGTSADARKKQGDKN